MDLACALGDARYWLWALANDGGPDLTVNAHIKTQHEAKELAENPSLEEAADVLISVMGVSVHQHWSQEDLARAVKAKVEINRARTWHQLEDGTWQHDQAESV